MRTLLALAPLLACGSAAMSVEFLSTQDASGEAVDVAVIPKRDCKAAVIGLQVYELAASGEVGGTMMVHSQYYRLDDRTVVQDEDTLVVKGFRSRDTVDVEDRKESKHWLIDRITGKPFDEAARKLAENPESKELVVDLYKKFRTTPFPSAAVPGGKSTESACWIVGKERCREVEFNLEPSSEYGNFFTVSVGALAARAPRDGERRAAALSP